MVDHVKCTYFDELAPRWDSLPAPADKMEEVARFCKLACPRPAARILDVGSGTGILAPHVLEDSVDGFRLVELDFVCRSPTTVLTPCSASGFSLTWASPDQPRRNCGASFSPGVSWPWGTRWAAPG